MAAKTPCWYCKHLDSIDERTRIATCKPIGWTVHSRDGCGEFEREPGVDDDAWEPGGSSIAPYKPDPSPAPRQRGVDGWWTEPPRPPRSPAPPPIPIVLATRDAFGGLFNWNDD